jgi:hypothetical protein
VLPSQKEVKDYGKAAFFGRNVSRVSFYRFTKNPYRAAQAIFLLGLHLFLEAWGLILPASDFKKAAFAYFGFLSLIKLIFLAHENDI